MKPILLVALAPLALAACNDMSSAKKPPVDNSLSGDVVPVPTASSTGAAPPVGLTGGSLGDAAVPPGTQGPPAPQPQPQPMAQDHPQAPPPPAVHREEPPPPPSGHEESEQTH